MTTNTNDDTVIFTQSSLHSQVDREFASALRMAFRTTDRPRFERELHEALNPLPPVEKLRRIKDVRVRMAADIAAKETGDKAGQS